MLTADLRHPNIIRLYDYFYDERHLYLMLEYAGSGELFYQLNKRGRFSDRRSAMVGSLSRVIHADPSTRTRSRRGWRTCMPRT